MFTVIVEYVLDGKWIQETLEYLRADSVDDAADSAYQKIKRENPEATTVDVLSVESSEIGI